MNDLDYTLLNAIKCISEESDETKDECAAPIDDVNQDTTDIDILDYIAVFVCSRIESVTNFELKGGYVLMKIIPGKARYSHDVDFSISSDEQYEIVKEVLNQLGTDLQSKGVIDSYEVKDTISPTSSGGMKLIRNDSNKKNLGIDIGWHDLSYGIQAWNIFDGDYNRFTVERMLSDKICAIYSRNRFRRAKDLYDVYIITSSCDVNTDTLRRFLDKRGIDWNSSPFKDAVIAEYAESYNKLNISTCNSKVVDKPEFGVCMRKLRWLVNNIRGERL